MKGASASSPSVGATPKPVMQLQAPPMFPAWTAFSFVARNALSRKPRGNVPSAARFQPARREGTVRTVASARVALHTHSDRGKVSSVGTRPTAPICPDKFLVVVTAEVVRVTLQPPDPRLLPPHTTSATDPRSAP
jgi:hypothetical protein